MQKKENNSHLNLPIAKGVESYVSFQKSSTNGEIIVTKKYRDDCKCIVWLNEYLSQYYNPKNGYPVAQHEYAALQFLKSYLYFPNPIQLKHDSITMTYSGVPLEQSSKQLDKESFISQAQKILKLFKDLGFYHNDLLPRNVLINKKQVKIIDFTLSEFNGIDIMSHIPNHNWAQAHKDYQLLEYSDLI